MNKWISVKKKLPDEGEMVLCVGTKGGMFIGELMVNAYRGGDSCGVYVPNSRHAYRNATHWMPLPEPPKQEDC